MSMDVGRVLTDRATHEQSQQAVSALSGECPSRLCERNPAADRILEAAEGFAATARQAHIRTEQFVRQWEDIVRRMGE